ncbi:hypothetical protein B0H13DRAFT_1895297 [Mycena leptocephala]|nr:hypothetical protein B0H13DRAFT_1895297 [Mycena leptocephala]
MLFKLPVLALFFSLAAHTQASSIGCQALCHTKWQNPTCFVNWSTYLKFTLYVDQYSLVTRKRVYGERRLNARQTRASQDWIELEVFGVRLEVSAFLSLETPPARPEQEKEGLKWKPNSKYTSMITAVRRLESRQDLKWENEIVIIFRDPRKALCFATGFKWAYPWIVRKAKTYCKTLFDVE